MTKKNTEIEKRENMGNKKSSRFVNLCPVFISTDVHQTVKFYVEKLGFRASTHYIDTQNFASLYRDDIEFIIVQTKHGIIESNIKRYGVGYDAYIDTATPEGIEPIFKEYKTKGVKILEEPHRTTYGSYEFSFEDIDGRRIGIGRIFDYKSYFKTNNNI